MGKWSGINGGGKTARRSEWLILKGDNIDSRCSSVYEPIIECGLNKNIGAVYGKIREGNWCSQD